MAEQKTAAVETEDAAVVSEIVVTPKMAARMAALTGETSRDNGNNGAPGS